MAAEQASEQAADRRALVTGATGGIGRAVSRALGQSGYALLLVARGAARLRELGSALDAGVVSADVSRPAGVEAVAAGVRARWAVEAPDLLVNAVGDFVLAPFAATSEADFERMLAANLRAPFLVIRSFLPAMLRRGSGHVITIGSVAGRRGLPHNAAYAAAKFGVRGLHAVLAEELRGTGVRSTLVEPAATDTSLWDAVDRDATPDLPPRSAMLSPDEVAQAVLYAASRPAGTVVTDIMLERG